MIKTALMLCCVLSSTSASAQCAQSVDGYCADAFVKMQVKRGQPAKLNVLISQSSALKVSLPPGSTIDAGSLTIGSRALKYEFDNPKAPSGFLLATRPTKRGSAIGRRTNVLFELAGQTIILDVKVSAERGAQQVTISFPELAAEQDRVAQIRSQMRADMVAELAKERANLGQTSKALAEEQIMDAALKRLSCSSARERGFDQFLTLITKRICAFGDWIFIEAVVENGRRKDFELADIAVEGIWDDAPRALPFKVRWITQTTPPKRASTPLKLLFEDAVRGMFLITPLPGELPDSYRITMRERGGLKRVVVADDIEF